MFSVRVKRNNTTVMSSPYTKPALNIPKCQMTIHTANRENMLVGMHNRRVSTFNLTNLRPGPIVAVNDNNLRSLTDTNELVAHCNSGPSDVGWVDVKFAQLNNTISKSDTRKTGQPCSCQYLPQIADEKRLATEKDPEWPFCVSVRPFI